ncbi:MAG: DUF2914 domain-containing protein [Thermodesulfovibrionia bacterium]|nr:DUF2914 domain-containing protein [Thermodesulfovibrionia bacterium]
MNYRPNIFAILITLLVSLIFVSPIFSMDDPEFTINRMVVCERVTDRKPEGVADTFSADVETVFCFLETQDINVDTTISFVWYFEGQEKARIPLPLQKGMRWRTYSSKKLANMKGNWTVELQETSGIVLNTISFKVQ